MRLVLVFPVNYAAFGVASPHMQMFSTLCRMGHSVYPAVEGDTLRVVRELKPDFVLATVGIWGEEARAVGEICPLVYYSGDEVINFDQYVESRPAHIFSHAKYWAVEFIKKGVDATHLPWAADPQIYFPVGCEDGYEFDVVFVGGSVYPKRWQAWEILKKHGVRVNVWNTAQTRGLCFDKVRRIYSCAKIVLAPAYFDEAVSGVELGQGVPCRIFEAAACGSFQLARNWVDLKDVFPSIVSFNALDEMVEKVFYFLDRDKEREEIAKVNREEFLSHHTYEHRFEKLIEIVKSL